MLQPQFLRALYITTIYLLEKLTTKKVLLNFYSSSQIQLELEPYLQPENFIKNHIGQTLILILLFSFLSCETNKNIDVQLKTHIDPRHHNTRGKIETNLPDGMRLELILSDKAEIVLYDETFCIVKNSYCIIPYLKNQSIDPKLFDQALDPGSYLLEIYSPLDSTLTDEIKKEIGENAEALIGKHIYTEEGKKILRYKHIFDVGSKFESKSASNNSKSNFKKDIRLLLAKFNAIRKNNAFKYKDEPNKAYISNLRSLERFTQKYVEEQESSGINLSHLRLILFELEKDNTDKEALEAFRFMQTQIEEY